MMPDEVWDEHDLAELHRMIPNLNDVVTHNPLSQVMFRAGLLACREYMARFVEQGGDAVTANSIRANWWPILGDDPGRPRQLSFDEIAIEETDGRFTTNPSLTASVEALARAWAFLESANQST